MKQHNHMAKLDNRRRDFDRGSQSVESKVKDRWKQGGYHRPGSMSK